MQVESTKESCGEPSPEERQLFAFQTSPALKGQCCPVHRKTACLANGVSYKPGESWTAEEDPCVTFTCQDDGDGQLSQAKVVQSCQANGCSEGYEYQAAPAGSGQCCGRCVQVACLLDGQVHAVGTTWQPDPCTFITCSGGNGDDQPVQLVRAEMMCSPQPPDCPDANWIAKEGECCRTCNATQSLSTCVPEALPLTDTVGYVRQGPCVNQEPVPGLMECKGHCSSGTLHEPGNIMEGSR